MGENGADLDINGERSEALAASTRTERTGGSGRRLATLVLQFNTEISKGIGYIDRDEKQHRMLLLTERLDERRSWLDAFEEKVENIGETRGCAAGQRLYLLQSRGLLSLAGLPERT